MPLAPPSDRIKILSFNILLGGDHLYPLAHTAEVIARAGADVVGIQEQNGNAEKLAGILGFSCHPIGIGPVGGGAILSRWPLGRVFPQGAEIRLPTGRRVFAFSVHLRPNPYEPFGIRDGQHTTAVAAIAAARSRTEEARSTLAQMRPFLDEALPVFLMGDFNEPSHLDWTKAAGPDALGLHALEIAWPTSRLLSEAGLIDAYRWRHPGEVRKPGYTWSTLHGDDGPYDRIDFLYVSGAGVTIDEVKIVGEPSGPDVDIIGHERYPSDHRAVLGEFTF
jgi:endonuclease/exonuclease/phosphatase family metal-dependent hydrolase